MAKRRYAGVDVGGRGKGFHAAVLDGGSVRLFTSVKPREVAAWLADLGPRVVAVDSPCRPAPKGRLSRKGERKLAAARDLPNVRPTPDLRTLRAREDGYYDWVLNGFRLYKRLEQRSRRVGWQVVECFPTASWTRWAGPRGRGAGPPGRARRSMRWGSPGCRPERARTSGTRSPRQ